MIVAYTRNIEVYSHIDYFATTVSSAASHCEVVNVTAFPFQCNMFKALWRHGSGMRQSITWVNGNLLSIIETLQQDAPEQNIC